jgi:hypothetical protein
MKKMDKNRDGINHENMVQPAYKQRGLLRPDIKNDENVHIQKNAQQTDQEEKDVHR